MAQQDVESTTGSIDLLADSTETVFRNAFKDMNMRRLAIDIGGSLTKIAYYSTVQHKKLSAGQGNSLSKEEEEDNEHYKISDGARLHFLKFETKYIETCLNFIKENLVGDKLAMAGKKIKATGGGAYKYSDMLQKTLGVTIEKADELYCVIKGCNFLLKNIPGEVFHYQKNSDPEFTFVGNELHIFPYLLCNIGSGVSIMKVESDTKYSRIGGSCLGGGTFWGLGSLLTKAKAFDELLDLAENGDHRCVDLLVKDIYGGDYEQLGLPGDLIASSFGKAMRGAGDDTFASQFKDEDLARSLLFALCNDIGQVACLYAMNHDLKRIYFGGYFSRNHTVTMRSITFAIDFWSKGSIQALFLRHEGYLGAIGAFLKGAEEIDTESYGWTENYAGSTGLRSPKPQRSRTSRPRNLSVDHLEMDMFDIPLDFCPLLRDPSSYNPDTVELMKDREARMYWLQCFTDAIDGYAQRAVNSQPDSKDAVERAKQLKDKYLFLLNDLRDQPFQFGALTVRSLLDMREHCLIEFNFTDPWLLQKQKENEAALRLLPERFTELDAMEEGLRQESLITWLVVGNIFDWGAKEVVVMMEGGQFKFSDAQSKLQKRPWLIDDLDQWLLRLRGPAHKCAVIFVDNSGFDIVLGIVPFVRELLRRGTQVILCANCRPVLNDITYSELQGLLSQVSIFSSDIKIALAEKRLQVMDSGQSSPCLDLSRLNRHVVEAMMERRVDLVVIEGMGRAVHTNLDAKFRCECLKLAVIKNKWLANRLGGTMFAVMCKYEPATV